MSLLDELAALPNAQARFDALVTRARALPPWPEAERRDELRVEGCLANLWIAAERRDGRLYFRCDSDSAITRAVALLLCDFASGKTPDEIAALDPAALRALGITDHLSPNRRNALARAWQVIRDRDRPT